MEAAVAMAAHAGFSFCHYTPVSSPAFPYHFVTFLPLSIFSKLDVRTRVRSMVYMCRVYVDSSHFLRPSPSKYTLETLKFEVVSPSISSYQSIVHALSVKTALLMISFVFTHFLISYCEKENDFFFELAFSKTRA